MPLYRWDGKRFRLISDVRLEDKRIEDMLEEDPTVIYGDEPIMVIGREGRVEGKRYDLLALDRKGNTVVIEVKRSLSPRNTIGQVLEYAARVSKLGYDELERHARRWFESRGRRFTTLLEEHRRFFRYEIGELSERDFNRRQRLVVFAPEGDVTMFEIARYLRGLGLDITYVSYLAYEESGETFISAERVVGKIAEEGEAYRPIRRGRYLTRDELLRLFESSELRETVERFLEYIDSAGGAIRARVEKMRVTIGGSWWIDVRPSRRGAHMRLYVYGEFMPEEVAELREIFPDLIHIGTGVAFNLTSPDQLEPAIKLIFEPTRLAIIGEG